MGQQKCISIRSKSHYKIRRVIDRSTRRDGNRSLRLSLLSECDLGNRLPKRFALNLCNFQLKFARLARTVAARKCACPPRRTTVHLGNVGQLSESVLVSEGNEDHAVVGEGRDCVCSRHFLSTAGAGSRHEDAGVLPVKRSLCP